MGDKFAYFSSKQGIFTFLIKYHAVKARDEVQVQSRQYFKPRHHVKVSSQTHGSAAQGEDPPVSTEQKAGWTTWPSVSEFHLATSLFAVQPILRSS
jgi:hypothetical protein